MVGGDVLLNPNNKILNKENPENRKTGINK